MRYDPNSRINIIVFATLFPRKRPKHPFSCVFFQINNIWWVHWDLMCMMISLELGKLISLPSDQLWSSWTMTNRFFVLPQYRRGGRRSLSHIAVAVAATFVRPLRSATITAVISRLLMHMSLTLDTHRNQKRNVKPK